MISDGLLAAAATHSWRRRGSVPADTNEWIGRLFKNSYTRTGRRVVLGSWSVKIQHEGHRRTFSLSAPTRRGAAIEARAIYESILSEGWNAVLQEWRMGNGFPKTEVRYWKEWLLVRRYHFSGSGG